MSTFSGQVLLFDKFILIKYDNNKIQYHKQKLLNMENEMNCYRCDREIPNGTDYFCLTSSVEHIDDSRGVGIIEVSHAESLIILCPICGNRFDSRALIE